MITKKVRIHTNLHARPAVKVSNAAKQFESEITIRFNSREVNAKSPVSVLSLCAGSNSLVELSARGRDEGLAVKEISNLLMNGLNDINNV